MTRLLLALAALLTVATPASGQLVVQKGERPPRRPEAECTEIFLPPAGDTTRGVYWEPTPRRMVLIDVKPPKQYVNAPIVMRMHVDRRGVVDSIDVTGISDSGFVRQLRKFSRGFSFMPTVYQACAVPGWTTMQFSFGAPKPGQRVWPDD